MVKQEKSEKKICKCDQKGQKRGKKGGKNERAEAETGGNHVELQIDQSQDFNELCSARPGGIKSVTPSFSAGAAIHCNSHSPVSAKEEQ